MELYNPNTQSDVQSVISDITDINDTTTVLSFVIEDKIDELRGKVTSELNKLNADVLKEKAKERNISGISKLKKPELVLLLETEFLKLLPILKEKKVNDLKNICKCYGIKGVNGSKKDLVIYQILLYSSSTLSFTLDVTPEADIDVSTKAEPMSLIEQLEKQKMEIELKLKEETRIQEEKRLLEEKRLQEEKALQEEKRLQEEKALQEEKRLLEEKALQDIKEKKARDDEEEKREAKKKKQSIPKNVRVIVWNHYIGEDIIKHKCLCCKKVTISNTNFEVGHVLSEKFGGTHEINNLRPICFSCNHSMGSENMVDFVVKFGLYIG
jgi:hypothetical protein